MLSTFVDAVVGLSPINILKWELHLPVPIEQATYIEHNITSLPPPIPVKGPTFYQVDVLEKSTEWIYSFIYRKFT